MIKPEKSYNQAPALVDKHPDLQLIISPTAVGTPAAAEACRIGNYAARSRSPDSDPTEMVSVKNGCALAFALWSFKDLAISLTTRPTCWRLAASKWLTEHRSRGGISAKADHEGSHAAERIPHHHGDFSISDKDNIDAAAK